MKPGLPAQGSGTACPPPSPREPVPTSRTGSKGLDRLERGVAAAKSRQSCPILCYPIDGSPPGSLSLGFSRQDYWNGLPFPSLKRRSGQLNSWDQPQPGTAKSAHQANREAPPAVLFRPLASAGSQAARSSSRALRPSLTPTIRAALANAAISSLASRRASSPARKQ